MVEGLSSGITTWILFLAFVVGGPLKDQLRKDEQGLRKCSECGIYVNPDGLHGGLCRKCWERMRQKQHEARQRRRYSE